VAGLIGSVDNLTGSGLTGFLIGESAATVGGTVEQFRNNLRYDYGEILAGANADGTLFNIRVQDADNYEFGPNLSSRSSRVPGVIDTGSGLALQVSNVRTRLEQNDIARMAYGLLLASKGEISQTELNSNPAHAQMFALEKKDALDRLNIDSQRRFRVNGATFELIDDEIRVVALAGKGAVAVDRQDPEIAKLRRQLASKTEALNGGTDLQEVDSTDASLSELIRIREGLESSYQYVGYSFAESKFIGSNNFRDLLDPLAEIADGFFYGANIAYQIENALGDDVSQTIKNELFPITLNYFASLVIGGATSLPTQIQAEFDFHAANAIYAFTENEAETFAILDQIFPFVDEAAFNTVNNISQVPRGAGLEELRAGLFADFSGGNYIVESVLAG